MAGRSADTAFVEVWIQANRGRRRVRLAPAGFLKAHEAAVKEGERIAITGYPATTADGEALVAVEVRKGNKTVTLRDARGRPAW